MQAEDSNLLKASLFTPSQEVPISFKSLLMTSQKKKSELYNSGCIFANKGVGGKVL